MDVSRAARLSDTEMLDPSIAVIGLEQAQMLAETIKIRNAVTGSYSNGAATVRKATKAVELAAEHLQKTTEFGKAGPMIRAEQARISKIVEDHLKSTDEKRDFAKYTDVQIRNLLHQVTLLDKEYAAARAVVRKSSIAATIALESARQASSVDADQFLAAAIEESRRNVRRAAEILVLAAECGLRVKQGREPTDEWATARAARSILIAAMAMATAEVRVEEVNRLLAENALDMPTPIRRRQHSFLMRKLVRIRAEAEVADYVFGRALVAASVPTLAINQNTRGVFGLLALAVRRLLPDRDGLEWWGDLNSTLGEADPSDRQRYIKSYLRSAPAVLLSSWARRLTGGSGDFGRNQAESALLARPDDPPGWRLAFSILHGQPRVWRRAAGLLLLIVGGLTAVAVISGGSTAAIMVGAIVSAITAGATVGLRRKRGSEHRDGT
ncbi:MAG TPA: hypothetical protein VGR06_40885 [Actinophytocola sp.]|jgi:hypothetical protein|uniref:hypothetical protein n=1 Tax=Actinophytocola sp. TaxID=1872138 RepID=UPI002DF9641F|nr:hypothetical protein [Actinophytocola sp.]